MPCHVILLACHNVSQREMTSKKKSHGIIFLNNIYAKYHIVDWACKNIDSIYDKKTWMVIYVFNFIPKYIGIYPFRLVSNHSDGLFIKR